MQIAIPRSLIGEILKSGHDNLFEGGHLGIQRTLFKIRMKYHWKTVTSDVVNFVQSCQVCMERKNPKKSIRARIQPFPLCSLPFQRVAADILGPFVEDQNNACKYIIVFIDFMTKYVILQALPDIKSDTCANVFIEKVLCVHGPVSSFHTDNGSNFKSKLFQDMCRMVNVKKTFSSSLHSEGNGLVERQMKPISDFLAKYTNDKHNDWATYVPFAQWVIDNSPSIDSNGYVTPYFLLHGRYPLSWLEINIQANEPTYRDGNTFLPQLLNNLERAREDTIAIMQQRQNEMRDRENKDSNHVELRVGDFVYLYKPTISPSRKLKKDWVSGFYIAEVISPIHVRLRRKSDGFLIRNRIHINRLKKATIRRDYDDCDLPPPVELIRSSPPC